MIWKLIAIFLALAAVHHQEANAKPQMMGDPGAQAMMMDMAGGAADPAMMGMAVPVGGGGDMMMGGMPGQQDMAAAMMASAGQGGPVAGPAGAVGLVGPNCLQPKCQTVCDFQRPVLRPEEINVAIPQPPKYEQVMVSPPKIHYCPGQVALQEVHQPPIMTKCVQNKLEYVPMRAEFESQPVDPSVLQAPPEQLSAPSAPSCACPVGAGGAYYGSPVKTSAL